MFGWCFAGVVFLDIQVSSIYLSGNVNDTELENNQVLNRHSLFICELWVRSYIFQFCYEKHHIYLRWSGGFKCAVVSSLWGSGVQRPPRAFDELRPCVRGWAQMTSPPPPFICSVPVFVPMKLASYRCIQSSVCVTTMRLPFERVTSINMHAFAYL